MKKELSLDDKKEILLDIFDRFIRRCEEKGFRYFLFVGSLIGAVRHQGFIPWDDDIDVGMPRPDYEAFKKDILEHPISDDIVLNDHEHHLYDVYPFLFSKLGRRDIVTECLDGNVTRIPFGIDIWIIEGIPSDQKEREVLSDSLDSVCTDIGNCLYFYPKKDDLFRHYMTRIRRAFRIFKDYGSLMKKADGLLKSCDYEKYEFCANLGNISPWARRWYFRREWFETTYTVFEGRKCRIPLFSHNVLIKGFGIWYVNYPPKEQRIYHSNEVSFRTVPASGEERLRENDPVTRDGLKNKPDLNIGPGKKAVLFYLTLAYFIERGEDIIKRLEEITGFFDDNSETLYPVWVRQPFLDEILKKTTPLIYKGYKRIFDEFVEKKRGITAVDIGRNMILPDQEGTTPLWDILDKDGYDPSVLFNEGVNALDICDAFYGSVSPYAYLYLDKELEATVIND